MNRDPVMAAMPPVKYSVTKLGGGVTQTGVSYPGGLDLTTPTLALQPGALRAGVNFEVSQTGGYGRIDGYERFDGHASPSDAEYVIVQVSSFVNVPSVGQTLSQATSGASGTIVGVNNVAGAYYIAVTLVSGTFDDTHVVSVGATTIGTAVLTNVAIPAKTDALYLAAAADVYRALIDAVPGSGAILGVVAMNFSGTDYVYAFRANSGNTATLLYQATSSGWTQVQFFDTVSFTAGGGTPADGDTLTQGSVTATIKRVVQQSGDLTGNSAVGQFVITSPSGGNFAAGAATTSSGGTATLSGAQTAISLQPGGKFQFTKCNFSGQITSRRIYGCDGVNNCFEFDGTTLVPIATGATPDAPSFIAFHQNYLFVAIESSILYCGVGTPYKWDSIDGGGEIATGDIVTGMITVPGSQTTATMAVFMRSNCAFLYGTDPTTFNYVPFNTGLGALSYSVQNLYDTFFFDVLGVVNMRTTLNWGNFLPSALNKNILPFVLQERDKLVASSVLRQKSQYRAFFNDGYGLWVTMVNQQYLGAAVVSFPNPVACCDEEITSENEEVTYFGSSDGEGYVYQMDKGTSFDGNSISAYVTMNWDALKSPRILKRWRAGSIEIQGDGYAEIQFGYQLGYATPDIGTPTPVTYPSNFQSAPAWDSFTWDNFTWDGQTLMPTDVDMTGTGENVQVTVSCEGNYMPAFNLNSLIYHYTMRRGIRV